MILIIDTTERHIIKLGLLDQKIKWFEFETEKRTSYKSRQSEELLIKLDQVLRENNLKLTDLKLILVNIGPGSFTGVRVGVTIANTLSWSLDIPVLGYRDGQINIALDKLKSVKNRKFEKITLPYYTQKQV